MSVSILFTERFGIIMQHINIGFLGLGLIGGSIARSIRKSYPDAIIQVYTRRKNPDLEKGVEAGIITNLVYTIDEHFSNCDIIFLCAPVLRNIEFLSLLKPLIKEDCIITDVGSVKGNIHNVVEELQMEDVFIGGHPMAGSEKTGFANSSAELLKDSFYLITPTKSTSEEHLNRLLTLLSCTDSICITLPADEHDNITAAISHVPHIIAVSLVNTVQENDSKEGYMKQFAAGGFKDITRIASSSPEMWENICLSNKESIDHFLGYYIDKLTEFRKYIADDNGKKIREEFKSAGEYRNSISDT